MFEFTVEVRDKTLTRVGQILPEDLNLNAADLFNNVGSWTLVLANGHPMVPVLRTPGAGIVVTRVDTGGVLFSGPVTSPTLDVSASAPDGTVTITGVTDDVILSDRLAYPQPSNDNAATQTVANDTRTDTAEALMHAYVNANVGPSAPTSRKDGRIVMGTNVGRGDTVTKAPRFQVLGALLDEIASVANYPSGTGRQLGFRIVQVGSTLQFQTYATNDQSAAVRFDVDNGTLASSKVATAAPTVTHPIVAGGGDGTDRLIVEVGDATAWAAEAAWGRRVEEFIDQRQTTDVDQLTAAGNDALAGGGLSQFSMQITPADDTTWTYGVDYGLGDIVTVVVRNGGDDQFGASELSTMVTGWVLKADSSGVRFGATLGQPTGDQLAAFSSRLSNLETADTGGGRVVQLADNGFAESEPLTSYPAGVSVMALNNGSGWSVNSGYGEVVTYYLNTSRAYQVFHGNSVNSMWTRYYYTSTWSAWVPMFNGDSAQINVGGTPSAGTSGQFFSSNATSTNSAYGAGVPGDTSNRFTVQHSGRLVWGPGNASSDTNLYRSNALELTTNASLIVTGDLTVAGTAHGRGIIYYGQITAPFTTATGTAEQAAFTTASIAFPTGRAYRVKVRTQVIPAVGGAYENPGFSIRETSTSGTLLVTSPRVQITSNLDYPVDIDSVIVNTSGTTKTVPLVLTVKLQSGTNTVKVDAIAPPTTSYFMVEDIGPSSKFSGPISLT